MSYVGELDTSGMLSEENFYSLHNALGNSGAKMVTLGALALHPELATGALYMGDEITALQGNASGWPNFTHENAVGYCKATLEPIGTVVRTTATGRRGFPIAAYQASDFGTRWGMAYIGAVAPWDLDTDHSLYALFGKTATTGSVRATEVRHKIWQSLTTVSGTIGYEDIVDDVLGLTPDMNRQTVSDAIADLARSKLVRVTSVFSDDFDPQIQIVKPEYDHHTLTFDELKPETKAHYGAIKALRDSGNVRPLVSEVVERIRAAHPELNPAKVRRFIITAINSTSGDTQTRIGVKLIDRKGIPVRKRTNIEVDPGAREEIADLLDRLDQVRNPKHTNKLRKEAQRVLNTPGLVFRLMEKAAADSPYKRIAVAGAESYHQAVRKILCDIGEVTTRQVHDLLSEQGNPRSLESIRQTLESLLDNDEVIVELRPISATRTKLVRHYRISENTPALRR